MPERRAFPARAPIRAVSRDSARDALTVGSAESTRCMSLPNAPVSSRFCRAALRSLRASARETTAAAPRQLIVMSISHGSMTNMRTTPPVTVAPLVISCARLCERAIFTSEVSVTARVRVSPCGRFPNAVRSARSSRSVTSCRTLWTIFSPARPIT